MQRYLDNDYDLLLIEKGNSITQDIMRKYILAWIVSLQVDTEWIAKFVYFNTCFYTYSEGAFHWILNNVISKQKIITLY